MRQIINMALSGDVGTGTTTLGKNVATTLGWQHLNAGDYFRNWHAEHQVPLHMVEQIPEDVDRELDERFAKDMANMQQCVFESHLAGWLARDLDKTFRVLCVVDESVAMSRIAARDGMNLDDATILSSARTKKLTQKFKDLYGVENPYDPALFDLVIDTTALSAGAVLDTVLAQFLPLLPNGEELSKLLHVIKTDDED